MRESVSSTPDGPEVVPVQWDNDSAGPLAPVAALGTLEFSPDFCFVFAFAFGVAASSMTIALAAVVPTTAPEELEGLLLPPLELPW